MLWLILTGPVYSPAERNGPTSRTTAAAFSRQGNQVQTLCSLPVGGVVGMTLLFMVCVLCDPPRFCLSTFIHVSSYWQPQRCWVHTGVLPCLDLTQVKKLQVVRCETAFHITVHPSWCLPAHSETVAYGRSGCSCTSSWRDSCQQPLLKFFLF